MNGKNVMYFAAGAALIWWLLRQKKSKQIVVPPTGPQSTGKAISQIAGNTAVPPNSVSTTVSVGPSPILPPNFDKAPEAAFTGGGRSIEDQLGISWKNQGTCFSSMGNYCRCSDGKGKKFQSIGLTQKTI